MINFSLQKETLIESALYYNFVKMILALIHFSFFCIVIYTIFFVVQYKDVNVEEYDWQNSTFEVSLEENSEPNIDISFVIPEEDLMDAVIDDRFVIGNLIASGHVGLIYTGTEINTGSKVVIKLSQPEMSKSLENEYHNYLLLGAADPDIMNLGIPQIIYFDVFGGYKVMVMHTMLGPTLRELKEFTGRNKLSFKTCMKVAIQAMDIFNYIHSKGLIVYDISSSNIAIGNAKETLNKIFIFDFASSFKSSPEDMLRNELNDLILFALVLMDLNGIQFTPMNDLSRNSHIEAALEYLLDEWDENYLEDLYSQSENPEVFFEYFKYLTSLKPEERVDYNELKKIFAAGLTYADFEKKSLGIFDTI